MRKICLSNDEKVREALLLIRHQQDEKLSAFAKDACCGVYKNTVIFAEDEDTVASYQNLSLVQTYSFTAVWLIPLLMGLTFAVSFVFPVVKTLCIGWFPLLFMGLICISVLGRNNIVAFNKFYTEKKYIIVAFNNKKKPITCNI